MSRYGVGRVGAGLGFYLVETDERGNDNAVYSDGKLVKFDSSEEAKEAIRNVESNSRVKKMPSLATKLIKQWNKGE